MPYIHRDIDGRGAMDEAGRLPVLALNAGSSTLKFGLYAVGASTLTRLMSGSAELREDGRHGPFISSDGQGGQCDNEGASSNDVPVLQRLTELLGRNGMPAPAAVGHRIVHGGPARRDHVLLDAEVLRQLDDARAFAPLHLPPALSLVRMAFDAFPDVPQVACLDTAFHARLPASASTLPIPRRLRELGLLRYGFHGLSCESILWQLRGRVPARLVVAHLGHGASVTAIADGRPVDTSMGLTPAGGMMMSTRCGDIDPGVLVYLVRELELGPSALDEVVNRQSGLLGVSGVSGDLRAVRQAAQSEPDAQLAIDMFCLGVRKHIAGMASVLGGIDMLVFTGGIGENDAKTRSAITEGLAGLGIDAHTTLPSQEAEMIARHTRALVGGGHG